MTFKTIEAELMPFLDKIEETRADDMLLFADYCMRHGVDLGKVLTDREYRIKSGIPSYDSIGRIRRKIQRKYPELKPSKEEIRKRQEAEKEYRKYARGIV